MKKLFGFLVLGMFSFLLSGCNVFQKSVEVVVQDEASDQATVGLNVAEAPMQEEGRSSLIVEDPSPATEQSNREQGSVALVNDEIGSYLEYSEENLNSALASNKRVILNFSADWCPSCQFFKRSIETDVSQIPDGIILMRVDYDSEDELKRKYGITQQHTFVEIDNSGVEIDKKFSGIRSIDDFVEWVN